MTPELPVALRQVLAAMLEGASRRAIAERAARLSDAYRGGRASCEAVSDATDVTAYLLARLPATYAAVSAVFSEILNRTRDFSPCTMLDVGAGPGTASWAAVAAWPALAQLTMLDHNPLFRDLARQLAGQSGQPALASAEYLARDLAATDPALPSADLVVASYALAEMAEERVPALAATLWKACTGLLVVVEPGTPAGFRRILACRDVLLGADAALVAPCPHALPCPLKAPDWCHFAQRLSRSRDHLLVKDATVPFEDEKFSYLVAARAAVLQAPAKARLLAAPRTGKAEIAMTVCTEGERREIKIPRRDRAAYARFRHARWGDAIE
jgi:ribosomal protein RSM22 (predicted rRNA methylase)